MKILAAVGCLMLIFIVTDGYFNCRRKGLRCVRGFCNFTSGACICPDGFEGKDCGLNSSQISTDCTEACENGGTCFEDENGFGCYCPEDYIGDNCEKDRAEVTCNGENMTITITPYTGFEGNIAISGEDSVECALERKEEAGSVYYEATLSLVEGCSANIKNDTPEAGDTTYMREVAIQYNPMWAGTLDQLVDAECKHSAQNVSGSGASMPSVNLVDERTRLEKEKAATEYDPIELKIETRDGKEAGKSSYVSEKLRLNIRLKDTSKYKKILVESCVAHNGLTGAKRKTYELISDNCAVAFDVIELPLLSVDDQTGVIVNYATFRFPKSKTVEFECRVRRCKEGDNRCKPSVCDNGTGAALGKRRRRDADASEQDVVVKSAITVLDPAANQIITEKESYPADCIQRTEILVSIIILATAVVVLFVSCFFLALKVIKSGSPKYISNETESSVSSDGSRLRIPRVTSVF